MKATVNGSQYENFIVSLRHDDFKLSLLTGRSTRDDALNSAANFRECGERSQVFKISVWPHRRKV